MDNKYFYNGAESTIDEINSNDKINLIVNGNNNTIKLNDFNGSGSLCIELNCNDSVITFEKDIVINNGVHVFCPVIEGRTIKNITIEIGEKNFFNGNIILLSPIESGNSLIIGKQNLFAGNIFIRARNDHVIYDKNTHNILNVEKSIKIGDRNWICENVNFLPGSEIQNDSVVALGGLVNKVITKSNVLLAGVPVEIKKKNICWSRASNFETIDFENPLNIKVK